MPFKKGDTRINRKGRPKIGNTLAERFRDAMSETLDKTNGYTALDSIIDSIVKKAMQGNQDAIEYCLARGWGKMIDRIENNNINKNYDFSNLSIEERTHLLELIKSAKPVVADDNPDSL
jgi:hypothetical protein